MTTRGAKVRAYRILSKMKRFEVLNSVDVGRPDLPLEPGEVLIGRYDNRPGSTDEQLLVTDRALLVRRETVWGRTEYTQMKSVAVEAPKHEAQFLSIHLMNGGVIQVPVRRGEGRLRDVWTFVRYLTRVIEDIA